MHCLIQLLKKKNFLNFFLFLVVPLPVAFQNPDSQAKLNLCIRTHKVDELQECTHSLVSTGWTCIDTHVSVFKNVMGRGGLRGE